MVPCLTSPLSFPACRPPRRLPAVAPMSGLGPAEVVSVVGVVLALPPAVVFMWWPWRAAPARRSLGTPAGPESEAPAAPDAAPASETPAAADAAPESEAPTAEAAPTPLRRAGGQLLGAREAQEDELGFIDGSTLDPDGQHPVAIVADGMGGHAGGEMASRLAVRAFIDAYGLEGAPAGRLRAALDAANRAIDDAIRENLSLDGMGATLVAAAVTADGLEWISVGDSPLYLYRRGRLKRLNEDHSMAPVIEALRESDPADGPRDEPERAPLRPGRIRGHESGRVADARVAAAGRSGRGRDRRP